MGTTEEGKKKTSKKDTITAISFILAAVMVMFVMCDSCGGDKDAKDPEAVAALQRDSLELVTRLNDSINMKEGMSFKISEFNKNNCTIDVTIPKDLSWGADVIGGGFCWTAVKWAVEKGYNVETGIGMGIWVYVESPFVGATGKPGMITRWGHAHYNSYTDQIDWVTAKKK